MSVRTSRFKLVKLTKELVTRWTDTKATWRDSKAAEFEKRTINGLTDRVSSTSSAIEDIEVLLQKIRKDCE